MKIAILGRGNIGGNLKAKFERAGHDVDAFGREGGDASLADVVVVAVPSGAIRDAFRRVTGYQGKITIDATNVFGPREDRIGTMTDLIKSLGAGPAAKAFNTNFAEGIALNDRESIRPGNLYASDPEATVVVEQLIRDAGFEPIRLGDLSRARILEDQAQLNIALIETLGVPFFYRYYPAAGR